MSSTSARGAKTASRPRAVEEEEKLFHRKHCFRIALALLLAAAAWPVMSAPVVKQLAPGVTLYQEITTDPDPPLVINAVTVDPSSPGVAIKAAIGSDVVYAEGWQKGRETISSLTARKKALLGINADFFPFTGDPLAMCIVDCEFVSEPGAGRAAAGVLASGAVFFDNPRLDARVTTPRGVGRRIDGINRSRRSNEVVVYTPSFGATTMTTAKGTEVVLSSSELPVRVESTILLTVTEVLSDAANTPIPAGGLVISARGPAAWFLQQNLKPGDSVSMRFGIKSANGRDWRGVEQAVGGGPWLLKDGQEFIDFDQEGFSSGFSSNCHPRTGLGVTADGKILLVTVDGRQTISGGISLPDLSRLMKRLGAVNAINLDGGGSTTLSARGILLNSPSGGEERPVANALLIYADTSATEELPNLAIGGLSSECVSGQGAQLLLTCGEDRRALTREQLDSVIWGTTNGVGLVDQNGFFTPIKARKGTVNALYGSRLVSLDVSVVGGPPAKLGLELAPDGEDACRAALKVTVYDANSNRLSGQNVALQITGGVAERECGTTDDKGEFSTSVAWDPAAEERIAAAAVGELTAQCEAPKTADSTEDFQATGES